MQNQYFEIGRQIATATSGTYKTATNTSPLASEDASKMLDTGVIGTLADYLSGSFLAHSRARSGRAAGLAEAAGVSPGLTVNYPLLSQILGGATGNVAGLIATQGRRGGGPVGSILGHLLTTLFRRRNINRIQDSVSDKDLKEIAPRMGSFILPFTAPTHRGHTDVYTALRSGKVPTNMGRRDFLEGVLSGLPPLSILGDIPVRAETAKRIAGAR